MNDFLEEWVQPQINDAITMITLHYQCGVSHIQLIESPAITADTIQLRIMRRGVAQSELIEIPDVYFGDESGVHILH